MAESMTFVPFDRAMMERWDREWLVYLGTESMYPHLVRWDQLDVVADLAGVDAASIYSTVFTRSDLYEHDASLAIWCKGDELIGKRVVEIGCGCGFLGKQLGLVADSTSVSTTPNWHLRSLVALRQPTASTACHRTALGCSHSPASSTRSSDASSSSIRTSTKCEASLRRLGICFARAD